MKRYTSVALATTATAVLLIGGGVTTANASVTNYTVGPISTPCDGGLYDVSATFARDSTNGKRLALNSKVSADPVDRPATLFLKSVETFAYPHHSGNSGSDGATRPQYGDTDWTLTDKSTLGVWASRVNVSVRAKWTLEDGVTCSQDVYAP